MSRSITAAIQAASLAENFVFGVAAEMDFSSGMVRCNTSPYLLTIGGNAFAGVGDLGSVSVISEDNTLAANGVQLQLSGINTSLLSSALNDNYRNRPVRLWLCLFDTDHQLIADPYAIGKWRMDTMHIKRGQTATITVTAESPLADWDRPRARYYTDQDQQSRYPGDDFFKYMPVNQDKQIIWGRA